MLDPQTSNHAGPAATDRTLREFAALWLLFFGGFAVAQAMAAHPWRAGVLALVALAIGVRGLLRPQAIRLVYAGAMRVTFPIGYVVSRLVLAVLFFLVITPVGVAFRLAGRDCLWIARRPPGESYWQPKPAASDAASYLRQF